MKDLIKKLEGGKALKKAEKATVLDILVKVDALGSLDDVESKLNDLYETKKELADLKKENRELAKEIELVGGVEKVKKPVGGTKVTFRY